MTALLAQLAHRAKAVAGAVYAGCLTYAAAAILTTDGLTLHGLEAAAIAALVTGVGVHQAPANTPKPKAKRTKKP